MDGAFHDKATELSPETPVTAEGALDTVAGVTGPEGAEAELGSEGGGLVVGVTAGATLGGVTESEDGSPTFGPIVEGGSVVGGKAMGGPR